MAGWLTCVDGNCDSCCLKRRDDQVDEVLFLVPILPVVVMEMEVVEWAHHIGGQGAAQNRGGGCICDDLCACTLVYRP